MFASPPKCYCIFQTMLNVHVAFNKWFSETINVKMLVHTSVYKIEFDMTHVRSIIICQRFVWFRSTFMKQQE